ncbi:MAG: outer membrane beta-barrel protein, partial [Rhizobacter sp.]|nr:outer membrane beta-barrel protein [Ferruginibacter sp.]
KTGKEGLSYNELSKYVGQDYEMIEDGTGSFSSNNEYENENYYGNGLPAVMSGGAHYSNKWKEGKQKLFSNYRIKQINAEGWNNSRGITILPDGTGFLNQSDSRQSSYNFSQKLSANFAVPTDSFSIIKISVNGNLSDGRTSWSSSSESKNEKDFLVNNSNQENTGSSDSKKFGSNISYQRKFRKEGRTVSLAVQQDFNGGNTDNYNYSQNNYYDPLTGLLNKKDTLDQLQNSQWLNKSFATKLAVTEKLSDLLRLSVEYGWKTMLKANKFKTFNNENGKYSDLLDTLSNNYDFVVNTNIAGTSLSWNKKKINITVGTKVYFTGFKQVNNDVSLETRRNFINLAPHLNIRFNLKTYTNLSLSYSGQTFQPSAEQLQPLRRSSNPLYVQIGNPNLLPGFRHTATINYSQYNFMKGNNLSAYASINYADNNIVSKTTTDAQNRSITQYINLGGIPGMNGYLNYSRQYKKLHLRPSVSVSINSSGNNAILNGEKIKNENFHGSANFSLKYDLPNKFSFGYAPGVNYNRSKSSIAKTRETISHTHTINTTGYLSKTLVLSSDCAFNFQPKNSSFNSSFNIIRWNASLEKKLLKNDKGFAKLSVNDILNNNTGYNRSIYGNSVYESDRLTIKRYFLLTIGWNFSTSIK